MANSCCSEKLLLTQNSVTAAPMPVLGMQTRDIHGPAFHPKLAVKPSLMMMIILLSALGAEV